MTLDKSDFLLLVRTMLKVEIGERALHRVFDSLDSACQGRIEWQMALDFITPKVWASVYSFDACCAGIASCFSFDTITRFSKRLPIWCCSQPSVDVVAFPCKDVVTCVTLSADCSVVGFGGLKFVRAASVGSR